MDTSHFCDQCGRQNTLSAKFCRGCGQSMHAHPSPLVQSTAQTGSLTGTLHNGQYQIVRLLGQGGMGAVYLAHDLLFGGRSVAIKEMSQSGLQAHEVADAVQAFQREALLLGNVRHHHLPRIYAHFEDMGRWYLVMDFLEGETLEEALSKAPAGCLPIDEVLDIGIQLSTVLHYLHTRQPPIIFRDLKPANIMREGETVYLIDFGIARHFKQGQNKDTTALGSSGYAAPEQYGKSQTTPRSDLYSLGATLYFLLSGDHPGDHPFRFPALTQAPLQMHQEMKALIQSLVEVDETKRPENAAIVMRELQRIAAMPALPSSLSGGNVASFATGPRYLTLLYAPADRLLALELENHLESLNSSRAANLVIWQNDTASGFPSTEVYSGPKSQVQKDVVGKILFLHSKDFLGLEEKREKYPSLPMLPFLHTLVTAHSSKPRHFL